MTAEEFEGRIIEWARRQPDIKALIQIGSRAQGGRNFDAWSDWDFHLISTQPKKYHCANWLSEIAQPWCANAERSLRGRIKVSAVFENGLEVDFVLLANWQMKLVYWGMGRPGLAGWMPAQLRRGILETREILLNSGYRVLIGGKDWEYRMTALLTPWTDQRMNLAEFQRHSAAFWQKSVWVAKKIARPEPRSAMHWLHKLITEHVYALLAEEAWLAGRGARPEALKAEKWLDSRRLGQTSFETGIDQQGLARTLLGVIGLFEEVAENVAIKKGFPVGNYSEVAAWLKIELGSIVSRP